MFPTHPYHEQRRGGLTARKTKVKEKEKTWKSEKKNGQKEKNTEKSLT